MKLRLQMRPFTAQYFKPYWKVHSLDTLSEDLNAKNAGKAEQGSIAQHSTLY